MTFRKNLFVLLSSVFLAVIGAMLMHISKHIQRDAAGADGRSGTVGRGAGADKPRLARCGE